MDDGVFKAAVRMNCTVVKEKCNGFKHLAKCVENLILKERKIYGKPKKQKHEALAAIPYDTSHCITDDGNNIKIRENVLIASDQKNLFFYQTNSTEVEAESLADYLLKVDFSADIRGTKNPTEFKVNMMNRVHVVSLVCFFAYFLSDR